MAARLANEFSGDFRHGNSDEPKATADAKRDNQTAGKGAGAVIILPHSRATNGIEKQRIQRLSAGFFAF
jgi:hypothetical protein